MLILEDGSKVADANTLITAAMVADHATLVGNLQWALASDATKEQAIYRVMRWFGSLEPRMKGQRTWTDQELAWPRAGVWAYGREIANNHIPKELKQALMEGALLELATPDALQPSQITGHVRSEKKYLEGVGGKETEYFAAPPIGAISRPKIVQLMAPFLNPAGVWAAH